MDISIPFRWEFLMKILVLTPNSKLSKAFWFLTISDQIPTISDKYLIILHVFESSSNPLDLIIRNLDN